MSELDDPRVVEFPLRGEGWCAYNSPADRIPSHGTDMLGQRFAFDLMRFEQRTGNRFHPAGVLRTLLFGVRTSECYGWGQPIHAPFDATVVEAVDGVPERAWIHPVRELLLVLRNALTYRPGTTALGPILGNHVILRNGDVYAGFAHLTTGSTAVVAGQEVRTGDLLGRVGHTGNSTAPHLHFQLMDSPDLLAAHGTPCAFRAYEVWRDGRWEPVERGIPARADRIRSLGSGAVPGASG
jgi:murein DD-endopeptidase MepM/ murein hydrolase activator NlpD